NMTLKSSSTSYGRILDFQGSASYDSVYNCDLAAASSTSSSTNHTVVYATSLTGSNNVIYNNKIDNGSYGIYWYGSSSPNRTAKNVIANNTLTTQYNYGIRAYYTDDLQIVGNTINKTNNTTTYYAMYLGYCYDALKVLNNDININITTSTAYGIYATYCQGSATNTALRGLIKDNDIDMQSTTGGQYAIRSNSYNTYVSITHNTLEMNAT